MECLLPSRPTHDGVEPQGRAGWVDRVVAQRWVKAMSLHIGLIHHIQPVLAAQLVPVQGREEYTALCQD